ncbi:glycine betaine ABC transporter substrate-binding protein [Paenibacillus sp. GSMTC-2017]|uniref:glycine betaine ABC transporter substrate-binding protein n=1 Tax=Paenibacillus sp. GSMTC-2017 TaxID=2794350 RepID=UPI0018D8B0EC|nr:glycine betaine ABC transporter substrate-binding protein [Paenibacillus sp. GSMTC-2017]MBH5317553.1 glycine betaine ABC transporter substrate-binding protein [Paenibacillus sp. GSMTC-2017]
MKFNKISVIAAATMVFVLLAGCSNGGGTSSNGANKKQIKLAYVAWDSEIASTYVVKEVLEQRLDYKVEMLQVDAGPMWSGISNGSADAMVAAWLPTTHATYADDNKGKFEDLGPNLEGTKLGLAVPSYMDIASIEDLDDTVGKATDYTIIGIEPGAGLMTATEGALEQYGLKDKWNLLPSSSAAMTKELEKAYKNKESIIVTGWTPHWKFAKMDLKYLEDPKGAYGKDEQIHTIVRTGLKETQAEAYAFLDSFAWSPDDMAKVMIAIEEGSSPEDAAKQWTQQNGDKVDAWLK